MVRTHPDPPNADRGGVAQLGERLLCKQEVIGSIPFTSTTSGIRHRVSGISRGCGAAAPASQADSGLPIPDL